MNLQDVIASLVLLSLLVNVADRLLTRRGMLLAFPRSGRLRYFFTGWSIVLAALALLSLLQENTRPELVAAPNGAPSTRPGNSGVTHGPPSVT